MKLLRKSAELEQFKHLRVENKKLRKRPFCYVKFANSDQHRLFIIATNVTF